MTITQISPIRSLGRKNSWVALTAGGDLPDHPVRVGLIVSSVSAISGVPTFVLPAVRSTVTADTICGFVGAPGVAVYAPISGVVTVHNPELSDRPELAVTDPVGSGWLFAVMAASSTDTSKLRPISYRGVSST